MAVINYDILERPPRVTWDKQGIAGVRSFQVSNLAVFTSVSTGDYTILAVLSAGGIPQRGTAWPPGYALPNGETLSLDVIEAEAQSPTQAIVTCTYRVLSAVTNEPCVIAVYPAVTGPTALNAPLVSVGSTVQAAQTAADKTGALMTVSYTAGSSPSGTSSVIADIQRPNTILRLTRRESEAPIANSNALVGCINLTSFYGAAVGTMLCTRCEGNTNDDGYSWIVEYEFQYNPNTWAFGAWYTDAQGQIPTDATSMNGFDTFDIYPTCEFNSLALGP